MRRIRFFPMNKWLTLAVVAVATTTIAPSARASTQDVSLTAAPAILDVGGRPGDEVKVSFRLTNNTDAVVPIQVIARDSQIRNGQTAELVRTLSAKSWLDFEQPDLVLQAKESKDIRASLRIPEDASPGGHYADLIAQPLILEGSDGFIATQSELAVQLLISVAGDISEELRIDLSGPSSIITARGEGRKLAFDISNPGNSHILFRPRLYLQKGDDDHAVVELLPQVVLPSERKRVEFELPDDLPFGVYSAQASADYGAQATEAKSTAMRIIVVPFGPLLLLAAPVSALAIYGFRVRYRILAATRIITNGK